MIDLMIQGKNFEKFAIEVLEPFFTHKIELSKERIAKINNEV